MGCLLLLGMLGHRHSFFMVKREECAKNNYISKNISSMVTNSNSNSVKGVILVFYDSFMKNINLCSLRHV